PRVEANGVLTAALSWGSLPPEGSQTMAVQTSMIEIQTPDGPMKAQLAKPDGAGPHPAVLVIMEAFGLNGHIKDVAQRIAAEGYVTLAPDVYHRSGELKVAAYDDLP